MIAKKILFATMLIHFYSYASQPNEMSMQVNRIPMNARYVRVDANNNNQQVITIRTDTGEVVRSNDSWKEEVVIQDAHNLSIQKKESPAARNQTVLNVINQNDHVIVQNNSQQQTVQRRPKKQDDGLKVTGNPSWYAMITSGLSNNKFSLVLGAVGLSWAAMVAKLLYTSYSIAQYDGWGTWYGHLALENGYQGDQAALAQKLFVEIQKKYQNKNINFLSPLVHFMNDVDEETKFLKNFLHMHELLNAIKLSMVFPSQLDVQATALIRIARLEFLKNVVINFAAEYKVS